MEGHHHREPVLPPEQDKAYSELNHHISGVLVLFAGGTSDFRSCTEQPKPTGKKYEHARN